MKSILEITDLTFIEWHLQAATLELLEVSESPFASGGYGQLFLVNSPLESKFSNSTTWLVKVTQSGQKVCDDGYRHIKELSAKLKNYQKKGFRSFEAFLASYKAIIGFPQAYFQGYLDGEKVYCYLMPNLYSIGYVSFSDIFEDAEQHKLYTQSWDDEDEIDRRVKTIYNLAKTFNLLEHEFNYLHGDIKSKSVFLNLATNSCAIIDYDGGLFIQGRIQNSIRNFFFEPLIFGEIQPWLAPEILKEVNAETKEARLKVTKFSEHWSFGCGAYTIINGFEPYSFLNEITFDSLERYVNENSWPKLAGDESQFKLEASAFDAISFYFERVKILPPVWTKFLELFNKGFFQKQLRPSYESWMVSTAEVIKQKTPEIEIYSPNFIIEGQKAMVSWSCRDGVVLVNGSLESNDGQKEFQFDIPQSIQVLNEFGIYKYDVPTVIDKHPKVFKWVVTAQIIKEGDELIISWLQQDVYKATAECNAKEIAILENSVKLRPRYSQEIKFKFYSKFNLEVLEKTVFVEVVHPVSIDLFEIDRLFIAESLPLKIKWMARNADTVRITGNNAALESSGEVTIRMKASGDVTISASNLFFTTKRSIYVEVLPVPKIENLKIPPLPDFRISLPDFKIEIPSILKDCNKAGTLIKQIFDEE